MSEKPWRDKETLERLYWGERLNQGEVANRLGCTRRTISVWMSHHDIETRKGKPRAPHVYFTTGNYGYERWQDKCAASFDKMVRVHRLLAVAEYGFDAVCDKHVHHKNGIRWDNRPENIELVTPSEHGRIHYEQGIPGWGNEEGLIAQHGEDAIKNSAK